MKKRRSPEFWARDGFAAQLLEPLAWANAAAGAARRAMARPFRADVPVLCVGNVVVGGAGKTPVAIAIAKALEKRRPHLLTRGYGGSMAGPVRVDPARHSAAEVGDEALLLARAAATWVARDRVAGARAAIAAGAGLIIMDDGFQNPSLVKDLSLLVIDGGYGFGNGRVLPAGPLRESVAAALARASAVVVMGEDEAGVAAAVSAQMVINARIEIVAGTSLPGAIFAFAGIGRPEKFFRTLAGTGARVVGAEGFPDHHRYAEAELERLAAAAERAGAALLTTEKDWVRLTPEWRQRVAALPVEVRWSDEAALAALLRPLLEPTRG